MMKESVVNLAAANADLIYSFSFVLLGELYLMMGRPEESLRELERAGQRADQMGHRLLEAGNLSDPRRDFAFHAERGRGSRAMLPARDRGCAAAGGAIVELRAATSVARLLARTGRREEARATVATAYSKFSEGFDTADLIEAKALIDEFSG